MFTGSYLSRCTFRVKQIPIIVELETLIFAPLLCLPMFSLFSGKMATQKKNTTPLQEFVYGCMQLQGPAKGLQAVRGGAAPQLQIHPDIGGFAQTLSKLAKLSISLYSLFTVTMLRQGPTDGGPLIQGGLSTEWTVINNRGLV